MNRTDRLLAIVLELQGRGKRRAEDLAATFEVSKRTIYRDIEALSEAGVPVAAAPGQGYRLVEGYFLPPLSFTADEAIMLILGSGVMQGSFDAQYGAAAEHAGRKIAGVLPQALRAEVEYLRASIRFVTPADSANRTGGSTPVQFVQQIRRAILEKRSVGFAYHARFGHEAEQRNANPYGLVHVAGSWYMVAHDNTRSAIRSFKLERIEGLVVLEETFERPPGLILERGPEEDRTVAITALFSNEAARWVRESPSYFTVGEVETPRGLEVTLQVRHEREVLQWLLGWGRNVTVLRPDSVRRMLLEEAEQIAAAHRDAPLGETRQQEG